MSLPTVKRWWQGRGVHLTVLNHLCGLVGLSLGQLFLELEGGASKYIYTLEQEQMLVNNPKVLAVFDLLTGGDKIEAIKERYSLKEAEFFNILMKLDRAGLVELHPKNKIKLKQRGEPQWIVDGPLSRKYRKKMIESFLGDHPKELIKFYIHDYLPEDVILLKGKLRELENLMETCNARGRARVEATRSFGSYLALKEFEWDVRQVLRARSLQRSV